MGISGICQAKCKRCKCRFTYYCNDWLFIDQEIIGTCDKCFNGESHICHDEFELDENHQFVKTGEKVFTDEETRQIRQDNDNVKAMKDYEDFEDWRI
jgi:hypothetical protein